MSDIAFARAKQGRHLAYLHDNAEAPGMGVFWLSGFRSDMAGTKAEAIAAAGRAAGRRCFRFDYSGHGRSEGEYWDFTLSDWLADTVSMFVEVAKGDNIIVGSSMGAYIALLLARRLSRDLSREAARIRGMVLIAPAADMTETLLWQGVEEEARAQIARHGRWLMPSRYGDAAVITRRLIEDGRNHLILAEGMEVTFPVRILHGEDDPDVPWRHGLALFDRLRGENLSFTLIRGGDHRLSSPRDLAMITDMIEALVRDQSFSAESPSR